MSWTKKTVLISVISLISFFIIITLLIPAFYSSNYGKHLFEKKLQKKINAKVVIESLSLSWLGPQIAKETTIKNEELSIKIKTFSVNIPFWSIFKLEDITKKTVFALESSFFIKDGKIFLTKENTNLTNLQAELIIKKNKAILSANGNASDPIRQGSFSLNATKDKNTKSSLIDLKSNNLPTKILDAIISLKYPKYKYLFFKVLGPHVDLKLYSSQTDKKGPVEIFINSDHCNTKMYFQREINNLYLKRDINASINISKDLSELIFQNINPLFLTGINSIEPCQIYISKKGFICPIAFNKEKLKINYGSLDMQKISAQAGDSLDFLITILKFFQFHNKDNVPMWFTPVNFQIENGTVTTDRMDVLIDNDIHVCTWGNINLTNKKVNMVLGLTADVLRKSFNIKNLSDDFVLQIPMKGKTDSLKLDTKKAAAQIALLIAGSKSKGLMGEVFGSFGKIQDKKAPPPKKPFPWENQGKYQNSQDQNPFDNFFQFFD